MRDELQEMLDVLSRVRSETVTEENKEYVKYIIESDTCTLQNLLELLDWDNDISLLSSRGSYSRHLDVHAVTVADTSYTVHAIAVVEKIDGVVITKSLKARCFKSLFKLLKYLDFYNIEIPHTVKAEVMI